MYLSPQLTLEWEGRSQPGRSGLSKAGDGHTTVCMVVDKTVILKSLGAQPYALSS